MLVVYIGRVASINRDIYNTYNSDTKTVLYICTVF